MRAETPIPIVDFETKELKTSYCIDLNTRDTQVLESCLRIKDRLIAVRDHDGHIAVVCYGPSLETTWEQVRNFKYSITCSGAHKFLIDHGVIPTWHCEVDPRPHKAELIGKPHPSVEYLVASVCHKKIFDLLEGYNVKLWHVFAHEAARDRVPVAYPRGEWAITGGSNVGLRAMVLARFLGFRRMTLFGMDYSFKNDGNQHAGWHPMEVGHSNIHAVEVDRRTFYTSVPMHHYAKEFFKEVTKIGQIELEVVGDGLLQAQIKERGKSRPLIPHQEKRAMIAAASPQVISTKYLELNRRFHQDNSDYGTSGFKRASIVQALIDKIKPLSVLDYGCGKGTLGAALAIPIWEYDPAMPGKDNSPRPADLVICSDVLEHIEPDYLDSVLLDLARCTLKVCYVVINSGPAVKTLPDGRNAHLIQEDMEWWKGRLSHHFEVAKIEMKPPEITVILGPKKKNAAKPEPKAEPPVAAPLEFSNRITPCRQNNVEVKFHTPDDVTYWRARTLFTKEPSTIEWINSMQPGDILFDVGANVGSYTIWAGAKGLKLVSFEPNAQFHSLLVRNIRLNHHHTSSAYCFALGDGTKQDFPALDDIEHVQPDHMKIDVDGDEPAIVRGAAKTIAGLKSLLVEVNTNSSAHLLMVDELIAMGFVYEQAQVDKAMRRDGRFKGYAEYIFRKLVGLEQRLTERIRSAVICHFPSPYIYVEDMFPEADYKAILEHLPKTYQPIEKVRPVKGYKERTVAVPDGEFWDRFKAQFMPMAKRLLCERFGISDHGLHDEVLLIRDKRGYQIGPHTDSKKKVISALFYLAKDESQIGAGTNLYVPKKEGFTCAGGPHYQFSDFKNVATMPFKPNSLFAFLKTDRSFHGVEPFDGDGVRDVLLYDVRKNEDLSRF